MDYTTSPWFGLAVIGFIGWLIMYGLQPSFLYQCDRNFKFSGNVTLECRRNFWATEATCVWMGLPVKQDTAKKVLSDLIHGGAQCIKFDAADFPTK